jgi:hypothetical protein
MGCIAAVRAWVMEGVLMVAVMEYTHQAMGVIISHVHLMLVVAHTHPCTPVVGWEGVVIWVVAVVVPVLVHTTEYFLLGISATEGGHLYYA